VFKLPEPPRQVSWSFGVEEGLRVRGWRDVALMIVPSGALAWAYALWQFGAAAGLAGGVFGAAAGILGARPLARLADRAAAEGGLRRWAAAVIVLVALWLALVIVPAVIGGVARSRNRPTPRPNQALHLTPAAPALPRVRSHLSGRCS
jgi:hypothetical protein